ncbi:hydrolase [Legionella israelensis]|uniref:Carboxypeptidase G2 n=1 Tax=Legionella israelensis TaxID=454 RepID=A0A0W0W3T7_9GAMM|nr:hydrolase [Legionella israelensis]KTD26867.1 carboxypeptidase G2 [Legionella israelensis]QBS08535.1 hydrolase [Legionella israelensis]SCX76537.1 glutamate carboxypeptidase [Legionella israelensis DSM 19235]STX58185.1 carboxypeptidase G2 [Legionella israelensis]
MEPLKELIDHVKSGERKMIDQLHQFCEINSGSENLAGLAGMSKVLIDVYTPLADEIYTRKLPTFTTINMSGHIVQQKCGDALWIRKRPELKRRVLLCGHMDTVYPADSLFQKLRYISDHEINGPGVSDMKGGLIVMLHALSAFEQNKAADKLGWDVLINADEEIGSPSSSVLFNELAPHYQAALVYEPAMTKNGTLAKNRKGSGKMTVIATGKAAHAGRAFYEGRNAICYMAEVITEIHALNGLRDGVTINVGKIAGGDALNIVPDKAVVKLDIRISLPEDEHWVRQQLNALVSKLKRPDYSLQIEGEFARPVKRVCRSTERLFSRLQSCGEKLALSIDWKDSGGCCDGNNLASLGLPVLDTLGVRGGHIHSPDEFIVLESLYERAALSALLLSDLAQGGLEDIQS